jgi:uncharacterized membrane protein
MNYCCAIAEKTLKKTIEFIKTTALGGLILILPFAVIIFVLGYIISLLVSLNKALAAYLPYEIFDNATVILAIAVFSIILMCFLAGLLIQTGFGQSLAKKLNGFLVEKLPMYGLVKNITQRFSGAEVLALTPAEVNLFGSDARSLAFIIEELPDKRYAMFVPSAPAVTVGQLCIVPASSVTILDKPARLAIDAITQWGSGTTELYKDETQTNNGAAHENA